MRTYKNYINKINSVLSSDYLSPDQQQLTEPGIMSLAVVGIRNSEYAIYKFSDGGHQIFPYFNSELGLRKMCDYILFLEYRSLLYIFAIELKRGASTSKPQLERSKVFLRFIVESVNRIECSLNKIDKRRIFSIRISQSASKNAANRRDRAKNLMKSSVRIQPLQCSDNHIDYTFKDLHLEKIIDLVL